jgi:hypothetical protein
LGKGRESFLKVYRRRLMGRVVHVYFGDYKKHPIINNYLQSATYDCQCIDAPTSIGTRLNRAFLMFNALRKLRKSKNFIFHAHDLLSIYLIKLLYPIKPIIFDSHEVYRSYFKGVIYLFVYFLEELSTLIVTYKFLPSFERSQLYFFKSNTLIIENLVIPSKNTGLVKTKTNKKAYIYAGLLSKNRCIKELIVMFGHSDMAMYNLFIYGQENSYIRSIIEGGLPENVVYGGELAQQELLSELPKYNASFALYKPVDLNNRYPAPTKIFENEFCGLKTIVFPSKYIGNLIKSGVLRNTYIINSISVNDFHELQNIINRPPQGYSDKILWEYQEVAISKIYENMFM